jgi:hypothetical protein
MAKIRAGRPVYILFVRKRGTLDYTALRGGTDKAELIAEADRMMLRGAEHALVVEEIHSTDPGWSQLLKRARPRE